MHRTAVLHYHLFKNAGTSVDKILKRHFHHRWVTTEFPGNLDDNSHLVADWIRDQPKAAVFSTHTALGPLPRIEGVRIISLLLLRDPVARIRSAYRFEQDQKSDTWGARLAKQHDLEGYVTARLANAMDRQCRNFQTHRLASMLPGDAPELERATEAAKRLSVVGLVEDFDGFLERMTAALQRNFPNFATPVSIRANTTVPVGAVPEETEMDRRVNRQLEEANGDDRALWNAVGEWLGLNVQSL